MRMLPLRRRVPQHTPASVSQATEKRTRLPTSYQHRLSVAARATGPLLPAVAAAAEQLHRRPLMGGLPREPRLAGAPTTPTRSAARRAAHPRGAAPRVAPTALAVRGGGEAAIDSSRPDARRRVRFLDRMPCRARAKPLPDSLSVYETFTRKPQPQQRRAENEEGNDPMTKPEGLLPGASHVLTCPHPSTHSRNPFLRVLLYRTPTGFLGGKASGENFSAMTEPGA